MTVEIRAGHPADAPAIAALMAATWPDDTPDAARIARLLTTGSGHDARLAFRDARLLGFVDAFVTTSVTGVRRWEVDLLAVDAAFRGQGIARRLIAASLTAGRDKAGMARGLVRLINVASERAFAAAGFTPAPDTLHLTVSAVPQEPTAAPPDALLIPVETFAYTGVWLEEVHTPEAFLAVRARRQQMGVDVAGAVIPPAALDTALACDFEHVGAYRWWHAVL